MERADDDGHGHLTPKWSITCADGRWLGMKRVRCSYNSEFCRVFAHSGDLNAVTYNVDIRSACEWSPADYPNVIAWSPERGFCFVVV